MYLLFNRFCYRDAEWLPFSSPRTYFDSCFFKSGYTLSSRASKFKWSAQPQISPYIDSWLDASRKFRKFLNFDVCYWLTMMSYGISQPLSFQIRYSKCHVRGKKREDMNCHVEIYAAWNFSTRVKLKNWLKSTEILQLKIRNYGNVTCRCVLISLALKQNHMNSVEGSRRFQ